MAVAFLDVGVGNTIITLSSIAKDGRPEMNQVVVRTLHGAAFNLPLILIGNYIGEVLVDHVVAASE